MSSLVASARRPGRRRERYQATALRRAELDKTKYVVVNVPQAVQGTEGTRTPSGNPSDPECLMRVEWLLMDLHWHLLGRQRDGVDESEQMEKVVEKIVMVPQVQTQEVVRHVPKVMVQKDDVIQQEAKLVEVPYVQRVEKIVEVPQVRSQEVVRQVPKVNLVQMEEKLVEAPNAQLVEKSVVIPQVRTPEAVQHATNAMAAEVGKHEPQTVSQQVAKLEVPHVQQATNVAEVSLVQNHEEVRHVPKVLAQEVAQPGPAIVIQQVEKLVELRHVQQVEEIVEVSQVPQVEKVEEMRSIPKAQIRKWSENLRVWRERAREYKEAADVSAWEKNTLEKQVLNMEGELKSLRPIFAKHCDVSKRLRECEADLRTARLEADGFRRRAAHHEAALEAMVLETAASDAEAEALAAPPKGKGKGRRGRGRTGKS